MKKIASITICLVFMGVLASTASGQEFRDVERKIRVGNQNAVPVDKRLQTLVDQSLTIDQFNYSEIEKINNKLCVVADKIRNKHPKKLNALVSRHLQTYLNNAPNSKQARHAFQSLVTLANIRWKETRMGNEQDFLAKVFGPILRGTKNFKWTLMTSKTKATKLKAQKITFLLFNLPVRDVLKRHTGGSGTDAPNKAREIIALRTDLIKLFAKQFNRK